MRPECAGRRTPLAVMLGYLLLAACAKKGPAGATGGGGGGATGFPGLGGAFGTGGVVCPGGGEDAGAGVDAGPQGSAGGTGDAGSQDAGVACNASAPEAPTGSAIGSAMLSIAGTWTFTPEGGAPSPIEVPGGGWAKQGFDVSSGTYATRITVPTLASGAPQVTLVEFGAVNHQATLSVDGAVVGTNTTSFTPSVFDVTGFVTPGGQHQVEVLVKGRGALTNAAGRKNVPDAAGWSPHIPQGIFRSANLRLHPDVYVSDVFVRTSVTACEALSADVWITNAGARDRELTLAGTVESWNCDPFVYPRLPERTVTVAAGTTQRVTLGPVTWGLGPASYWWPNVPYRADYQARLHNLRVVLREAGAPVHERVTRFGFRETAQVRADAANTNYTLNGVRVNFRGDNLQGANYDSIVTDGGPGDAFDTFPGFLPPRAGNPGWPQAVRNYQRLNYNVNRIHQEPATPYMLDVADELGLMIIDETAIRGSGGDQDFVTGHDNMVDHARQLVLRDRNHPSVIRWSQSNEPGLSATDSVGFQDHLYRAIMTADPTRPVSTDVNGNVYDALTYPNFAAFPHYVGGLGVYTDTIAVRADRPYGQGEFIWPKDVTRQGLMWFATATMSMRAKNASDVRPYTLLSGWASVIPGVTTSMMRLEPTYPERVVNPPLFGEDNLPDPWSNPILMRIARAFNPVLVADVDYWAANRMSNAAGDWPVSTPPLRRDVEVSRNLIVFNDTFEGTRIDVTWEMRAEAPDGAVVSSGTDGVDVPLGSRVTHVIRARTPATGTRAYLVLVARKDGVTLFEDAATWFTLD